VLVLPRTGPALANIEQGGTVHDDYGCSGKDVEMRQIPRRRAHELVAHGARR